MRIPSSLLKVADALAMGTVIKTQDPNDWLDANIRIICEIANGPYPDLGMHRALIRNSLFPVRSIYFHWSHWFEVIQRLYIYTLACLKFLPKLGFRYVLPHLIYRDTYLYSIGNALGKTTRRNWWTNTPSGVRSMKSTVWHNFEQPEVLF